MKYQHIVGYVASQLWAIEEAKLQELLAVLAFRAAGHVFTADEIRARIGGGVPSAASSRGSLAVIPVRGVIANRMGAMDDSSGGTSCERIAAMIDEVAANPAIPTILYDFDTPGGTIAGLGTLADKMFALRGQKTQIAMVSGMCASAGYWLASQCDEIVSSADGQTGSIGVRWMPHADISGALAKEGIVITEIYSGKYKIEGTPNQPLSAETIAFKQAQSDAIYSQFKKAVARGRGVTPSAVEHGYGEGRVLFAKDAKAADLIDRIATMDETIARLTGRKASAGPTATAMATHEAIPEADRCATCKGAGLKPEKYMSDPEGQEDCPDCQGTGRKPAAAAMALSGMADVRARRLL